MSAAAVTAAAAGLVACHACGQINRRGVRTHAQRCARCGAPVHVRKPASVTRTWAFIIAAAILYVPANVLPIMQTSSLFASQSDTIMSGVMFLWHSGSWPLAVIVFVASIMVPLAKLMALVVLVTSVQLRANWGPVERTRLYRAVEFVGRWSMLDVYVVSVLVALVHLQSLAVVQAQAGAVAFGAVVVLTMFAAMSFDPRLIWDRAEDERG